MKRSNSSKRPLFVARSIVAAAVVTASAQACSNRTSTSEDADQAEMQPVVRAVFAHDRLWLLHLDGSLVSLDPDDAKPDAVASNGKLIEICKSTNRLIAIMDDGRGAWTLQQYSPDRWAVRAKLPANGDTLVAMDCADGDITLVTNRRLLEVQGGTVHALRLKQELQPPLVNGTALAAKDAVWVGFNIGEWGGGLRRIDRSDGQVATIERNQSGELCGGPLNTSCDPVNGVALSPWKPSCVVAAVGLVHMMAHGRIVEVCGKEVRRLYFKPLDPQPPRGTLDDGEPSSTVAFFGLAHGDHALWAIGIDGLYRFTGPQSPEFRPLPKFQNKGGYWVSFDVPGIALVMTGVNQRASMSGAVPIMAVR
ncbi:hypothetical protein [Caenibius tardaugens]|uniref:hypothetical protein n=2 Tax=Caenibius tardaugens TaxID=169176 RepID=UPI0012374D9D|nr:hypothetical protein [Caenibius tardaugens]